MAIPDYCRCTATSESGDQCTNQVSRSQRGRPDRLCDPCRKARQGHIVRQPGKPNLPPVQPHHPCWSWRGKGLKVHF